MARTGVFMSQKAESGGGRRCGGGGAGAATTGGGRHCCGLERLMRKLRKRSRMYLCMAAPSAGAGASSFRCQYDPLSYSRNFDGFEDDDDSTHFCHTFSSRFVNTTSASSSSSSSKIRNPAAAAATAVAASPSTAFVTSNH